ncbi:L-dopachrome tautomerase-related protein [Shewanella sp. YLB-07]|uniref:L-dopachrome tautomerase-related protein n=1 Tax=Shewanella sp. YLB-07 TaxID=2601268 RepID=UPI00128CB43D|nr:L-dopachrome tautomerase-related protein [Shewanella sp. YLB-07]
MKKMLKPLLALLTVIIFMSTSSADDIPFAKIVTSFDERPGNLSITPDGRIIMSFHPLGHPSTKLVEIDAIGEIHPYPSKLIASGIDSKLKAPLSIRTDDAGIAWILDLGSKRLIGWDTIKNNEVKNFVISDKVLTSKSFLQDFALDQKRHRVIIADMTQSDLKSSPTPAFITIDLKTGAMKRIAQNHASMMPDMKGGFALNPITIDPNYEWVYFGAMHGKTLYRVPAASFDGSSSKVEYTIERYAPKPFSDGITVDGSGNVYINDIEMMAIGVTNLSGYHAIAKLPMGQSWPDGISFGPDGYVYSTTNQLDRFSALNGGKEEGSGTYDLIRVKALADGKTGR